MEREGQRVQASDRRRGYCPGVWTPMRSGDGLIVRVQTGVSPLRSRQLRALAQLAEAYGNGLVELTRRANLQLRGVREEALNELQAALVELGLAHADRQREQRLAPLLLDPRVFSDEGGVGALLHPLRATLTVDPPSPLPSKLCIIVEQADAPLADVESDVRFRARPDGRFDLSVADRWLGVCSSDDAARALGVLLQALASAQSAGPQRMRALVTLGLEPLRARVGGLQFDPPSALAAFPAWIGSHQGWTGFGLPFGAGDADALRALADLSEQYADGLLRTTPRGVLLQGVVQQTPAGWIRDPSDPRLQARACAGAPACTQAAGETRALASELAALLSPRLSSMPRLHVSGCEKGCAHRGPAEVTVVHGPDGVRVGFGLDIATTAQRAPEPRQSALERLAASLDKGTVRAAMPSRYEYERDGEEIYRRSFAMIRAEARLERFSPLEERVAVRMIHTSGMVDLADDLVFSARFADGARAALLRGAPVFCDATMIVRGVTRSRLPANNDVLCLLDDPRVPELARAQRTTRSAAALALWGERLHGAVVAIGNAPTALFRLLELLDEQDVRPAAVIGVPVGFVGAAESKQALIDDGRVPALIVRGRRGGSALAASAVNALASERE